MTAKAVLFDAGGTLIHLDRRFLVQTLNECGVAATLEGFHEADEVAKAEVRRIMRSEDPGDDASRWQAYAAVLMRELRCEGEALGRVRAALVERHMAGTLWTYVEEQTTETLQQIKDAGYRVGIVSNADGRIARFLAYAGLDHYFDVIVDSGVFGIEKPDPRIFLHACEQLGVQPQETVFVGDIYEIDVMGARAAGLLPVLIMNGGNDGYDCPVIRSIPELVGLLSN